MSQVVQVQYALFAALTSENKWELSVLVNKEEVSLSRYALERSLKYRQHRGDQVRWQGEVILTDNIHEIDREIYQINYTSEQSKNGEIIEMIQKLFREKILMKKTKELIRAIVKTNLYDSTERRLRITDERAFHIKNAYLLGSSQKGVPFGSELIVQNDEIKKISNNTTKRYLVGKSENLSILDTQTLLAIQRAGISMIKLNKVQFEHVQPLLKHTITLSLYSTFSTTDLMVKLSAAEYVKRKKVHYIYDQASDSAFPIEIKNAIVPNANNMYIYNGGRLVSIDVTPADFYPFRNTSQQFIIFTINCLRELVGTEKWDEADTICDYTRLNNIDINLRDTAMTDDDAPFKGIYQITNHINFGIPFGAGYREVGKKILFVVQSIIIILGISTSRVSLNALTRIALIAMGNVQVIAHDDGRNTYGATRLALGRAIVDPMPFKLNSKPLTRFAAFCLQLLPHGWVTGAIARGVPCPYDVTFLRPLIKVDTCDVIISNEKVATMFSRPEDGNIKRDENLDYNKSILYGCKAAIDQPMGVTRIPNVYITRTDSLNVSKEDFADFLEDYTVLQNRINQRRPVGYIIILSYIDTPNPFRNNPLVVDIPLVDGNDLNNILESRPFEQYQENGIVKIPRKTFRESSISMDIEDIVDASPFGGKLSNKIGLLTGGILNKN